MLKLGESSRVLISSAAHDNCRHWRRVGVAIQFSASRVYRATMRVESFVGRRSTGDYILHINTTSLGVDVYKYQRVGLGLIHYEKDLLVLRIGTS